MGEFFFSNVNLNGRWHVIIGEPFFSNVKVFSKGIIVLIILIIFFFVKLILVILVKSYFTSQ